MLYFFTVAAVNVVAVAVVVEAAVVLNIVVVVVLAVFALNSGPSTTQLVDSIFFI